MVQGPHQLLRLWIDRSWSYSVSLAMVNLWSLLQEDIRRRTHLYKVWAPGEEEGQADVYVLGWVL